jgi:hypothetical protein
MNLLSFVDELMKVGAMEPLIRKHADAGDAPTVDIPQSLMGSGAVPTNINPKPDEASTRLRQTGHLTPAIGAATLGPVLLSRDPIDREKYNRAYRDRR